jgi:transcriptional regulator with XRE-family HTH domain
LDELLQSLRKQPAEPIVSDDRTLVRQRTSLGLSQKESAERLGVDPSTLARWERGEREPVGAFLGRVKVFLQEPEVTSARRVG